MAVFIRLVDYNSSEKKERGFFDQNNRFIVNKQDDFSKIPGSPIAYWVSNKVREIFENNKKLIEVAPIKKGMSTGNNDYFLRNWFEVMKNKVCFNYNKDQITFFKWFPYNKGGTYRKWYGNREYLINWEKDGFELKHNSRSVLRNQDYYFKESITWTAVGSSKFGARYCNEGALFDGAGSSAFPEGCNSLILSFLCSNISFYFLNVLIPTLNFEIGTISSLPIILPKNVEIEKRINLLTLENIDISREEWDSRETSWDFRKNELLHHKTSNKIKDAYNSYCAYWKEKFQKIHANEGELNRIFIDIYNLADEITPDVPLQDITILREESEIKDGGLVFKKEIIIKQFISYAVGCMFGRFSPDTEGLILANKGETIKDFTAKVPAPSFMPDDDNIIPVLEDEYFKDDIVSRFKEFLKVTFGAESLAENLDFIAGSLSKTKKGGESSEKIIRDYFLKSFFKDHTRTYQKRPIYWLFTSGKGRGFNALLYMHRYDKTTLAKMRTDYLLELEAKLDARIGMLADSARDKQEKERLGKLMQELVAYDEKLNNKALGFIDIDLDDGVTANYAKFEGLVEGI